MAVTKEELTQKAQELGQAAGHAVEQVAKTVAREDVQVAAKEILKAAEAVEDKKSLWGSKTFLASIVVFVLPLVCPPVAAWKIANPYLWDAAISFLFGGALRAVTTTPVSVVKAPQPMNYLQKFFAK